MAESQINEDAVPYSYQFIFATLRDLKTFKNETDQYHEYVVVSVQCTPHIHSNYRISDDVNVIYCFNFPKDHYYQNCLFSKNLKKYRLKIPIISMREPLGASLAPKIKLSSIFSQNSHFGI